jgi:hypothetical protein
MFPRRTSRTVVRQYSIWKALGVNLRLFSPVSVIHGIGIEIFWQFEFPVSPTIYSTFCLQIARWILVPLLVATLTWIVERMSSPACIRVSESARPESL